MCDVVERVLEPSAWTFYIYLFIYSSSYFHLLICFLNRLLLGPLSCCLYLRPAHLGPVTVNNLSANKSTKCLFQYFKHF